MSVSQHIGGVAESCASVQTDSGKAMYRELWITAQSRLAEIEDQLNAITGEQCGIFDNLEIIAGWGNIAAAVSGLRECIAALEDQSLNRARKGRR